MAVDVLPNPFAELYRRVSATARIRFIASRRLAFHQRVSEWIVSFAAVVLITIPLLQAFRVTTTLAPELLAATQVFFAVIALVFSLHASHADLAVKSEKMHQCGLDLSDLFRRIEPHREGSYDEGRYVWFASEYDQLLRRYENHDPLDYTRYTLTKKEEYYPSNTAFFMAWALYVLNAFFSYSPYFLITGAFVALFWLVASAAS